MAQLIPGLLDDHSVIPGSTIAECAATVTDRYNAASRVEMAPEVRRAFEEYKDEVRIRAALDRHDAYIIDRLRTLIAIGLPLEVGLFKRSPHTSNRHELDCRRASGGLLGVGGSAGNVAKSAPQSSSTMSSA